MPAYKDKERDTWYCKFNYRTWQGEIKTKLKRGFRTKKEAQEWEREFLQEQQANMDMELEAFVKVYFNDKAGRLKERSLESKRIMIESKVIPYFGKKRMNQVTPADIMKWQNEIMAMGYKPTYQRMLQNQVNALFNHAERFYGLKNNPCKKVDKMGRSNAKELNFWTKDEYDTFIRSFSEKEEMYRMIFQMLFWCGCRIGEVREYTSKMYELNGKDRIFPVTERAVQKKLKQKTEKLGLTPIRVHDLRHSHIAFLIEKGVQPLVIAKRVGHDSVNTTMNIYGHLYPDKQKQLADMLNAEAAGEVTNQIIPILAEEKFRKAGG